jgi:hypothetical protein
MDWREDKLMLQVQGILKSVLCTSNSTLLFTKRVTTANGVQCCESKVQKTFLSHICKCPGIFCISFIFSPSSGVKSVKIRETIMKGISLNYVQSVLKKMTNGRNCKVTWIVLEPSTSFSISTNQSESVTKYKF